MLNIMKEGGFNMWLLVAIVVVTAGYALTKKGRDRGWVLVAGTIAALVSGMAGMATGLAAVSKNYTKFPDPIAAMGEGLGELSHNGTVGATIAALLGVWAILALRSEAAAAPR